MLLALMLVRGRFNNGLVVAAKEFRTSYPVAVVGRIRLLGHVVVSFVDIVRKCGLW